MIPAHPPWGQRAAQEVPLQPGRCPESPQTLLAPCLVSDTSESTEQCVAAGNSHALQSPQCQFMVVMGFGSPGHNWWLNSANSA